MNIPIGKDWEFELNLSAWHPLKHISFKKSIDIHIYDEEFEEFEPCIYINISFICVSLELYLGKIMGVVDDET